MKVNLGRQTGKKYVHSFRRNVNTTGSFGFMQPTFCRELIAQDTITLRSAHAVRLAPLVKPTFGRLEFKQYNNFVPIESIWHPFASFLSGKPYQGVGTSYIPTKVPSLPLNVLTALVCYCGRWSVFSCDSTFSSVSTKIVSLSNLQILRNFFLVLTSLIDGSTFSSSTSTAVATFTVNYTDFDVTSDSFEDLLDGTDFIIRYTSGSNPADHYLILVRLSDRGRNLRKILIGLGYQLNGSYEEVSILPLVAYYKSWFDQFAIQRTRTWKDTDAFSFMEYLEQYGVDLFSDVLSPASGLTNHLNCFNRFLGFFYLGLSEDPFYTINPDYASAHITGLSVGGSANDSFGYLDNGSITPSPQTVGVFNDLTPEAKPTVNGGITQQALDILKRLYNRININTAVGGRISEYMRTIFGSDYLQEEQSNFIGSSQQFIDIDPVMNQAATAQGDLGEYAGQAYAQDAGQVLKFTARVPGYVIQLSCLIPDSSLAQAVDPTLFHKEKYDFGNVDFDAVTLLPSRKLNVYGTEDYFLGNSQLGDGFGNIPNYTEYKIAQDCINGDMSLRSTRLSFLPYTMAKLLPFDKVQYDSGTQALTYSKVSPAILVASDFWRSIGRYRWFGNFDRIFVNQGVGNDFVSGQYPYDSAWARLDDNFLIYIHQDFQVASFLLPLSDSFQTDPFNSHGHISVQKA